MVIVPDLGENGAAAIGGPVTGCRGVVAVPGASKLRYHHAGVRSGSATLSSKRKCSAIAHVWHGTGSIVQSCLDLAERVLCRIRGCDTGNSEIVVCRVLEVGSDGSLEEVWDVLVRLVIRPVALGLEVAEACGVGVRTGVSRKGRKRASVEQTTHR